MTRITKKAEIYTKTCNICNKTEEFCEDVIVEEKDAFGFDMSYPSTHKDKYVNLFFTDLVNGAIDVDYDADVCIECCVKHLTKLINFKKYVGYPSDILSESEEEWRDNFKNEEEMNQRKHLIEAMYDLKDIKIEKIYEKMEQDKNRD